MFNYIPLGIIIDNTNKIMHFTKILVIFTVLYLSGDALKCHHCKTTMWDGEVVADGTVACDGSEKTCETGLNACVTNQLTYKVEMGGQKRNANSTETTCGVKSSADDYCEYVKGLLTSVEDLTCSVVFCDKDLCTSSGKAAHISFVLGAFLMAIYGLFV